MTDNVRGPASGLPSMLVRFAGENVRSFRDPFEISLLASAVAEKQVVRHVPWREGDTKSSVIGVLPAAGFFGANGSGKSNILRALDDMRTIVLQSFRRWTNESQTQRSPFRLDDESPKRPSRFEIDIVLDGVLHQYGFVLDDHEILSEWAHRFPKGRIQRIFDREGPKIVFGSGVTSSTARAADVVRSNALLLSTAVAFKDSELQALYDWFSRNLRLATAANRDIRQVFTAKQLDNERRRDRVLRLLRAADLGVVDAEEIDFDGYTDEFKEKVEQILAILNDGSDSQVSFSDTPNLVALVHRGANGQHVRLSHEEESLGTAVWLGLAGPIIDALDEGSVLLADELDASLHPVLVEHVIRLFQQPDTNPNRAQLLFNSHDAHLLGDASGDRTIGRDQVWFTEKRNDGGTTVYPLSDLNPRRQEAVAKRYLEGRYGAVPIIAPGDFEDAVRLEPVP